MPMIGTISKEEFEANRKKKLGPKLHKAGEFPDLYQELKEKPVSQPHDHITKDDAEEAIDDAFKDFVTSVTSDKPILVDQEAVSSAVDEKAKKTVPEMLRQSAATYEERNKLYGDNYKHFGKVMMGIFPNGLTLSTEKEWNRFGVLTMIIAKITRIGVNFPAVHDDSALDISVYSAMLRELGMDDQ